ncbi:MAG TPA: hypothetical protein VES38_06885 [Methylotenera sp.]|nr:hypothetical protein [Methylotenera sp.]
MPETTSTPWNPISGINNYATVAAVPEQAATSPAAFNPATAATTTAATRAVDTNELMSSQANKVIGEDSPLMQQAAARAKQAANGKGLLNSTMAVQAGQAAVMDRALPIAQYDAGVKTNVSNTNQANTQQTNVFNAGQTQDVNKFNAGTAVQNSQFNAGEANKTSIVNASESNKILAQMMDQETRKQLSDIEASYKVLMQSEASAMSMYQQSVKNISEILMNPDLTAAAKTSAVSNQNQLLKTGMNIIGKMSGLNLEALLTFPAA